jgi:hypothetical protein
VIGPIEILKVSCGKLSAEASSNARRFVAVELLVNVMAAGRLIDVENSSRIAAMESVGMRLR